MEKIIAYDYPGILLLHAFRLASCILLITRKRDRLVIVVVITEEQLQSIESWILSLMLTILFSCGEAEIATLFISIFFLKFENTK